MYNQIVKINANSFGSVFPEQETINRTAFLFVFNSRSCTEDMIYHVKKILICVNSQAEVKHGWKKDFEVVINPY